MHEPATLLTDCLLAALAGGLAWHLHRRTAAGHPAARWWSCALGLTALSALGGGGYHGFAPDLPAAVRVGWWTATLLSLCLVSAAMALSLRSELQPAGSRNLWLGLIATQFTLFAGAAIIRQKFAVVVIDYGLTMLAWAGAALLLRRAWRGWMLAAIGLSGGAALVQQLGWAPARTFNHNDLYHVIQALALACFYAAGRRFTGAVTPLSPAGP